MTFKGYLVGLEVRLLTSDADQVQNDRIKQVEKRLLTVEQAVQELGGMAKIIKAGIGLMALSLGVDIQGML